MKPSDPPGFWTPSQLRNPFTQVFALRFSLLLVKSKPSRSFHQIGPEAPTNMADLGVQNKPLSCDPNYATTRIILRTNAKEDLRTHRNPLVKSVDQLLVEGIHHPSGSLN